MILYIIRHALAGQHGDPRYPDDSLRPLTKKGRKQFKKAVKKLSERGFDPTHIATSPLVRCRQTAEIVAEQVSGQPSLVELDALAPDSDLARLIAWTEEQDAEAVAWVGHAPDVDTLTAALIGRESEIRFAKGAIAAIEFADEIGPGRGELCWLVTPKILGC